MCNARGPCTHWLLESHCPLLALQTGIDPVLVVMAYHQCWKSLMAPALAVHSFCQCWRPSDWTCSEVTTPRICGYLVHSIKFSTHFWISDFLSRRHSMAGYSFCLPPTISQVGCIHLCLMQVFQRKGFRTGLPLARLLSFLNRYIETELNGFNNDSGEG